MVYRYNFFSTPWDGPKPCEFKRENGFETEIFSVQFDQPCPFLKELQWSASRCMEKEDVERVLKDIHDGPAKGHFVV
jgi:hypothetical protein